MSGQLSTIKGEFEDLETVTPNRPNLISGYHVTTGLVFTILGRQKHSRIGRILLTIYSER